MGPLAVEDGQELIIAAFAVPLVNEGTKFAGQLPGLIGDARSGRGPVGNLLERTNALEWVQNNQARISKFASGLTAPAAGVLSGLATGIAGTLTVFFRIVLPLSVPALASLVIFQFLWIWNDLLVALIYVGGSANVAPVTVTLANLTNSLGQGYHLLTAAAFLSMIVPLVVFVSLQRYFVRGILAGSVKG